MSGNPSCQVFFCFFLTSITSLPVLQMTINYVRYYAVSPGVASECAHNIQLVRESSHRMEILETNFYI